MNSYKIEYKGIVNFTGRNGWFKSNGVYIDKYDSEDQISIYPRTTRNKYANCCIEIPVEEIDNLIEILKKLKI
jgi:hypothetical protein